MCASHTRGFSLAPEPASPSDGEVSSPRERALDTGVGGAAREKPWTNTTHAVAPEPSSWERRSPGHLGGSTPGRPRPPGCSPAPSQAGPPARPPTLRHVQLKVAGRELIQALLELRSAGRLHCGLWSLMGETEQESPRMCVEAPWSDHGFCLEPCAAAPDSSLQGMLLCRGAPQAGSNLIGARGPLASAVGLMLQGNQVTTSPRSQTCPLLPSNPTQ